MIIRIGTPVAVPVDRDSLLFGTVQGIRIGLLLPSSVTLTDRSLKMLDDCQIMVGGSWHSISGVMDAEAVMESLLSPSLDAANADWHDERGVA